MLVSKQELPIQVAQVDRVEIDNVNFAEAGEEQVLEELTADPTCSDQQDARLSQKITAISMVVSIWRCCS